MKIPVSIIEDHSDCLFQLQRLLGRNKLPLKGFSMLHFDSHPDMCASPDFREENLENAQKMRENVSIESWILPLVVAGHLKVFSWITCISDPILVMLSVGSKLVDPFDKNFFFSENYLGSATMGWSTTRWNKISSLRLLQRSYHWETYAFIRLLAHRILYFWWNFFKDRRYYFSFIPIWIYDDPWPEFRNPA